MSPPDDHPASIAWRPWEGAAFAEARAARKPVLLSIATVWSAGCREMDAVTYAHPAVARAVTSTCVPVRVDADERPDIADRYALGGIPTTAFLTGHGHVLGGGTFVDPERLLAALPRAGAADVDRAVNHRAEDDASRPDGAGGALDEAALSDALFSSFDLTHGGFGGAPKVPHVPAIQYALDVYAESADPLMLERATRALDGMGWSALYDEEEGGFRRYCRGADWTEPAPEKLLPLNAAHLGLYARAAGQLGVDRWAVRAADTAEFLQRCLRRHDGTWRLCAPPSGGRVYADANAAAVSALLEASRVLQTPSLGREAVQALEQVLLSTYAPGGGVAHFAGGPRGLLVDQVTVAAAALDAWDATGQLPYRMIAEELMLYARRTMWDETAGGFVDREASLAEADPPGAARQEKPFALNCSAAVVLSRIAEATGEAEPARQARAVLTALAPRAAAQGPEVAPYLIARRAVLR